VVTIVVTLEIKSTGKESFSLVQNICLPHYYLYNSAIKFSSFSHNPAWLL